MGVNDRDGVLDEAELGELHAWSAIPAQPLPALCVHQLFEAQVRRGLSGNLCRCGNYNREVAAVLAAAKSR